MARFGKVIAAGLVAAMALILTSNEASAQGCRSCGGGVSYSYSGGLVGNPHRAALNTVPAYAGPAAQLWQYPSHNFTSNYYVGPGPVPGYGSGYGAALYMAPHPVPPHVGSTVFTYEPFMPHEMLYRHHKTYHNYYNGGRGMTRTSVIWR